MEDLSPPRTDEKPCADAGPCPRSHEIPTLCFFCGAMTDNEAPICDACIAGQEEGPVSVPVLSEELVKRAYRLFLHEAEYPASPAAMREAIQFVLGELGGVYSRDGGEAVPTEHVWSDAKSPPSIPSSACKHPPSRCADPVCRERNFCLDGGEAVHTGQLRDEP